MTRNKLYIFLGVACFVGFMYLLVSRYFLQESNITLCLFKNISGYNCPSCGTTRAVSLLLEANFSAAFRQNPLGIIVLIIMITAPLWIAWDVITRKDTLFQKYKQTEAFLQKPLVAVVTILLFLLLWFWNLTKTL
jgi:hypothetical protein